MKKIKKIIIDIKNNVGITTIAINFIFFNLLGISGYHNAGVGIIIFSNIIAILTILYIYQIRKLIKNDEHKKNKQKPEKLHKES